MLRLYRMNAKVCRCEDSKGSASESRSSRFAPTGPVALYPQAYGLDFLFMPEPEEPKELRADGVAVVSIVGPLEHHASWWCDSYEAIRDRFDDALALNPKVVLLQIDSPGGLVAGCFELAAYMRDTAKAAGVPLYAHCEGMCASAAYALACAASKIVGSSTSMVGSIGVIDALVDATAYDAAWGVKWKLITSGARKADGNPHQPITDGAEAATQARVDQFAQLFFDHVAASRAMSADAVRDLNADIFIGARAQSLGLLDAIGDSSVLLTDPTTETAAMPTATKAADEEPKKDEAEEKKADESDGDMYRKLRKMADEGDEDAKKMVKKLEGGDDDADEKKAETEEPAKKDSEDAKAIALRTDARLDRMEREQLLAKRPDIDGVMRDALMSAPIAKVRAVVAESPKRTPPNRAGAAQPEVRPAAQPSGTPTTPGERLTLSPAITANDEARHRLVASLTQRAPITYGARVVRNTEGHIHQVEIGVVRALAEGEKNPDHFAPMRRAG
jgi:signal peptide peptidase SppA